jgi:hypothetical protein
VAACGGDDDGDAGPSPTSAASTPTGGQQPAQPTATSPSGGGNQGDGAEALRRAGEKLRNSSYRATYEFKGTDPDSGDIDAVLVVGSKPPKRFFSLSGTFEGERGTIIAIDDGETNFLCFDQDGEQGCLKTGGAAGVPSILSVDTFADELLSDPSTRVARADGQTIAGRRADCFDIAGSGTEGKVCVSQQDGHILLMEGTFDGVETQMRLRDLSGAPPDSDFEPPYEVVQF